MSIKQIKKLVEHSYTNNRLDEKKVTLLTSSLSRRDLKKYIKELKRFQQQRTILIVSAQSSPHSDSEKLAELFPDKELDFTVDPSLMVGVKIVNNDLISEFNLKNTLKKLKEHILQQYD